MSSEDKDKIKRLQEAYDALTLSTEDPGSEAEELAEELRKLRSGTTHKRVPTPPPLPSPSAANDPSDSMSQLNNPVSTTASGVPPSQPSQPSQSSQLFTNPIKVLPTTATVREFTGTDSDYSAREFINLCEDVMANAFITEGSDKISFVRSKLQQGSRAALLMQASAFTKPLKERDYKAFRSNFLQTFGDNFKHNLVKGVHLAVEKLLVSANSQDMYEAQVGANGFSEDIMKYLKDNKWADADNMPTSNVSKFLEFFAYMLLLKGKTRKGSQALSFEPTDELHEFVAKLRTRLDEKEGEAYMPTSAVAASRVSSAQELDSTYASVTASRKPQSFTCTYCNREGHSTSRCFIRMREQRKAQKKTGATSGSASFSKRPPLVETSNTRKNLSGYASVSRPQPSTTRGAVPGRPYCSVHDSTTHSTDDCFAVVKLRSDVAQKSRGSGGRGAQSGEAARPRKTEPG